MKDEVQLEPPGIIRASDSDPLLKNQEDGAFRPSSSEIKDGDNVEAEGEEESGLLPCCRICLETESNFGDDLITPCMCKGTQQFVHRSCLDHWRSVKVIAVLGGSIYVMDKDGTFRNSFSDGWDRVLSTHPIPFYYCIGVLLFFVVIGFFGLLFHCSSMSTYDPRLAGCQNCCYGWGILDCFPASMEACFALVIVFVVIFAIVGIAYGFLAATMAIQRIGQKHYHILTKRELTKEYIVEDLHGCYTPPKLDTEHEQRLKLLKLM
uniref:RING-CH-type domain-containing protein n=1 Tax=Kalanchoe fedtschenkoi TaxID=63787 RepID=A0A7N0U690_KALFE